MRASCSPTIGPRRTIIGPRDQWEGCIHGEEMLGTKLRDMSAPARDSKQSGSIKKARAQAAPITKRKEDSTYRTIGVDGRVQWVAAPPAYGVLPARLGNFQSWSMAIAYAGPNSAIVEPKPYARSA